MKKFVYSLVVLIAFEIIIFELVEVKAFSATYDATGTWYVQVYGSYDNCPDSEPEPDYDMYVTVVQDGNRWRVTKIVYADGSEETNPTGWGECQW